MATIAVETTADTTAAAAAATTAVQSTLTFLVPPLIPQRSLSNNKSKTQKSLFSFSDIRLLNSDTAIMASKNEASSQPTQSSTPPPPPPPHPDSQTDSVTSPLPPDLPPPPDFYQSSSSNPPQDFDQSSSPPPPPPPPSYLFPELSSPGDLPLPPPPQVLMSLDSQSHPVYICSYDPPSPEIKSEYDPQLPPEFISKSLIDPLSPLPPPLPPPPRPSPPPPPTPPVRRASKENLDVSANSTASGTVSSSAMYLASAEETQTKDSLDGTNCDYPTKDLTDTVITGDSIEGRPTSSGLSSSTLTATFLLTPESGLSPLPPHALRVSPVPTEDNTESSRLTDDLTNTSMCSDCESTPNIFDSRDTTFDIDTPEVTPQLSEILGTHSPTPNEVKMNSIMDEILADKCSSSDITPHVSEGSGSHSDHSATPTENEINVINIDNKISTVADEFSKDMAKSQMVLSLTTSPLPDSSESEKYEDSTKSDSLSENVNNSNTEKHGLDHQLQSLTTTSNTEPAQMSSPFSTEPPSLFSLPTDSDTISADIDSLAADTMSPMADFESYPGDVDTSTIDSISTTRAADMFLTSSSGFSESAYATADSNMESATMSPTFTKSCTITPIPVEFVTPMSTNPTTPIPSPIPSSPLPYFDAVPPDSLLLSQSHISSINPLTSMVSSASKMIVSSSEHHSEYQSKDCNNLERLVSSQLPDTLLNEVENHISQETITDNSQNIKSNKDNEIIIESSKQNSSSSIKYDEIETVLVPEKVNDESKEAPVLSVAHDVDLLKSSIDKPSENSDDVKVKTNDKAFRQTSENFEYPKMELGNSGDTKEEIITERKPKDLCSLNSSFSTVSLQQKEPSLSENVENDKSTLEYTGNAIIEYNKDKENEVRDEGVLHLDAEKMIKESNEEKCATYLNEGHVLECVKEDKDKLVSTNKEIENDNENIICKDLPNSKMNTRSDTDEPVNVDVKILDNDDDPLRNSLVFDFSCDIQSPSEVEHGLSTEKPSITKIKSFPSSPFSSSPPNQSVSMRFGSCGGSMSPKIPLSPARSPISTKRETRISTSPKTLSSPFSKSPKQAMEILDNLVGDMEIMLADLPPSPISIEAIKDTTSANNNLDVKIDTNVCEVNINLEDLKDDTEKNSQISEISKIEDKSISKAHLKIDELPSNSQPSTLTPSEIVTPTKDVCLSHTNIKKDNQENLEKSLAEQYPSVDTRICNGVEPSLPRVCTACDVESTPSNDNKVLHATNTETKEDSLDAKITGESVVATKIVNDSVNDLTSSKTLLDVKSESDVNENLDNFSENDDNSCIEMRKNESTYKNNLDSIKDSLNESNVEVKIVDNNDSTTSFSSPSLHSIVEDAVQPSPASRAKTPPLPPPRSYINTPRPGMGPPLPPPRQYMLIPINSNHESSRRQSPPPAPPRSTSVRRSPPPPPPRSTIATPSSMDELIDFPPLPPPPASTINTPSTPPKLTPVPEESSFPTTPLPPKELQVESSPARSTSPYHRKSPCNMILEDVTDNEPKMIKKSPESNFSNDEFPNRIQSKQNVKANTNTVQVDSSFIEQPTVQPMPIELGEEQPPTLPPPPVDYRDDYMPPIPLLPSDPKNSPPTPPTRNRISTPPLPPPPLPKLIISSESYNFDNYQSENVSIETNKNSILGSDLPSSPCNTAAMSVPTTSSDIQDASYHSTHASTSTPVVPPPPTLPASSSTLPPSSNIPCPPPLCAPPPPRCPTPQTSKTIPNSALWTVSPYGKVVINRNDLPLPSPEEEIRKTFHNIKNWGLLDYGTDTLAVYTQLRPNIQMGPQCGLVALSMGSQVFPETKEITNLLNDAKEQKFTSHGEMFSCENMAKLANSINGMEATVRRDVLCNPKILLDLLIHGNLILAPYDSDQNHMPNLRNGHKAHWGIICGCLVQSESLNMHMGGLSKLDSRVDNLWHVRPRSRRGAAPSRDGSVTPGTPLVPSSPRLGQRISKTPDIPVSFTPDSITGRTSEMDTWSVCSSRVNTPMLPDIINDDLKMVVLWRQGKSRNLIAAPLEKLCESNDQLLEYPSPSTEIEHEFIIGSVQDGLAGQVVVLHKTKTALSDLVGILQDKQEPGK